MALGIASNFQFGLFNVELLKLATQHRQRRHSRQDTRQAQGFAPFAVVKLYVAEFKPRHQPTTLGTNLPNLDAQPQGTCGLLLQYFTVIANSRHNENV